MGHALCLFMDWLETFGQPDIWPRWARRLFLLTLPIAFPLWAAACIAGFALILVGFLLATIVYGVRYAVMSTFGSIATFWSRP